MLAHHDRGICDIDADFNHRSRNQDVELAFLEEAHHGFLQVGIKAAMQKTYAEFGKNTVAQFLVHFDSGFKLGFFVLLDDWIHHVGLMADFYLLANKVPDVGRAFVRYTACNDWSASRRHLVEDTDVEVAVKCECARARDGSGSHDQNVGLSLNTCRAPLDRTGRSARPYTVLADSSVFAFLH